MPVRIKDWIIPYTWWQWIEITNNHVINVLLREMNNLIHVNGDRELYVDLQLPSGIKPTDTFPVGVTTGKILQADWWQQSWLILNWKTTSWDYVRLIYANDGKLYHDKGDWVWVELGWWAWECKVHIFEPLPEVNDDITDLYTSVSYDKRYITVIVEWDWKRYGWYVTGHVPTEDWYTWHIYGVWYGWQLITSLDISFVEINGRQICTWVKINKYEKWIRVFSVPNIWDEVTEMYNYLTDTSNVAIFITDNPLPSIFPNGTPYAIWTMSTNYIDTQNTVKMYTFVPWEWPKAITVWFTANANWYECSSLALNVPATVLVDSVAPNPEQWTLWYDMSNSALKIYDWSNRQTV